MAMKRTASDILAEQHWKRRLLNNEPTATSLSQCHELSNITANNAIYNNQLTPHEQDGFLQASVNQESLQSTAHQQQHDVQCALGQHQTITTLPSEQNSQVEQADIENGGVAVHVGNNMVFPNSGNLQQETYTDVLDGNVEVQAAAETLTALQGGNHFQAHALVDQIPEATEQQDIPNSNTMNTESRDTYFETRQVYSEGQFPQPVDDQNGIQFDERSQALNESEMAAGQTDEVHCEEQQLETVDTTSDQNINSNNIFSINENNDGVTGILPNGEQCGDGHGSETIYAIVQSSNCESEPASGMHQSLRVESTELAQTGSGEIQTNQQPENVFQVFNSAQQPNQPQFCEQYSVNQINEAQVTVDLHSVQTPPVANYDATGSTESGCEEVLDTIQQPTQDTTLSGDAEPISNIQQSLDMQQQNSENVNYTIYVTNQELNSNGAGYGQSLVQNTDPVTTQQNETLAVDVSHFQSHIAPQDSSNNQEYLENEQSYLSQTNFSQNQQLQNDENCDSNYFFKDYMHSNNSGISNQDLQEATEVLKENAYGAYGSHDNGNYHVNHYNRRPLSQMNVPAQHWPAHGPPVCSAKPCGPPRHYRPAPYTFPVCSCNSPANMPSCRSCPAGHSHMTPRTRHTRSSYVEYSCREAHKVHPRKSSSCCHVSQHLPHNRAMYSNDQHYSLTPGAECITPMMISKQMGDFTPETARLYDQAYRSNSWNSFSSDLSSDSESPKGTSRAQPGLGFDDYEPAARRRIALNSLYNPHNPILRSLPPPGLERTKFLVSTYIDYLVEENERITDMSKAFTPPTYLFLEEEQYVRQAHKTESPFPSTQFSKWIKQFFPQVDALSVPEIKSVGSCTNISRLNLSEKDFEEFAHTVFFGCQDMQEKNKVVPVESQLSGPPPMIPQAVTGN